MAYFPQNDPQFNHLRHLMLMYGNAKRPWTTKELRYSVAHLNPEGTPDDWLFDSFLFLNQTSAAGRDYLADVNLGTTMSGEGDFRAVCSPRPAGREDWDELVEFYLGSDGAVEKLNQTVEECGHAIGRPYGHKRNVVLMLPYPHVTQKDFGELPLAPGSMDFTTAGQDLAEATAQRLNACRWFVDVLTQHWQGNRWRHLNFLGVYWMFETVYRSWDVDDHWLLKELRRHVNQRGLKFLWIPFLSSYNVHLLDDYQRYYFDLAFLQPNYMFYREGKSIEAAAEAARKRNAGIEMEYYLELNEPIAVGSERHARFREYLDGGVTHGYMTESACAHFQGSGSLARMHRHDDPVERGYYEDICRFVKGTYRVPPENGSPPRGVRPQLHHIEGKKT
jgi:hypothetical protein